MAFDGLSIGRTSLLGNQVALDTIGKNIAHANDPTYARRRVETQTVVDNGITTRVTQAVNESLEEDLLKENAGLGYYQSQTEILQRLEDVINEVSDQDLSSALDDFYASLEDLSLTPHDVPTRLNVVQNAEKLTDIFHVMGSGLQNIERSIDREVEDQGNQINQLLNRIGELNDEIAKREGGVNDDPAHAFRDERRKVLRELSDIIDISTSEQSNGTTIVQSSGRILVLAGEVREVNVQRVSGKTEIRWRSDNTLLTPKAGRLAGLLEARDEILPEKSEGLDALARNLAWEMNKIHSTGRGLKGLTEVTGDTRINSNFIDRSLDIATVDGLSLAQNFKPQNGILTVSIRNDVTGDHHDVDLAIDIFGDKKMSLADLRDDLDQVQNLNASIDVFGRMSLNTDDGYSFHFKEDTSNVTAFLGIGNFFDGNSAANFTLNESIKEDPELLAAAKSDAPGDNSNLLDMINSRNLQIDGNQTLFQSYQRYVADVATESSRIDALRENQERILGDVEERRQSFSGVNLDEEAARLLQFQRSFQASARYIAVQDEILQVLLGLV